jgi:hypothetical protein
MASSSGRARLACRLEGEMIPSKHLTVSLNIPRRLSKIYKPAAGLPYPKFFIVRPTQQITCGVPRPPDWVGHCRTSRT